MDLNRRDFIVAATATALAARAQRGLAQSTALSSPAPDRQATVRRHNPVSHAFEPYAALTLGNGNFAFTADATGLQTFPDLYNTDFPLCTTATWAWHTTPPPSGLDLAGYKYKDYDVQGRKVGYAVSETGQKPLSDYLRENPHRMHLGRIAFELKNPDGSLAKPADITNISQTLDLWAGVIVSQFSLQGRPVRVTTCVHPEQDVLAVRVESPLLADRSIAINLSFPYPSPNVNMTDWNSPGQHLSKLTADGSRATINRTIDSDAFRCEIVCTTGTITQRAAHEFVLSPGAGDRWEFAARFAPASTDPGVPTFTQALHASANAWAQFWSTGGAIDFSDCTDERAHEIERRMILSRYNTRLHCAGPMPPAETGLLFNSWYGKAHLEMHWWHGVHFAAWDQFNLLAPSLAFYQRIYPIAQATAQRQGYEGVRWPKMVGPDGHDSPSPIAPLLIWQQPHPIYYAELAYRNDPTASTLEQWKQIVFGSADFMASYAHPETAGRYSLGPPMKTVSENADTLTTTNPTFELAYWRFGLTVAQTWRKRLGLSSSAAYAKVLDNLAMPATQDGLYLMQEGMTDTYTKWNYEHPALLGALGVQPGLGIDKATMARTMEKVAQVWEWDRAWGWDFPMAAMCAARSERPEIAVQSLLIDSVKNRYHPNGHNYQRPNLTAYLPGNGGLLSALAMMCAGWSDGPSSRAPGFPTNGKWNVRYENLKAWI